MWKRLKWLDGLANHPNCSFVIAFSHQVLFFSSRQTAMQMYLLIFRTQPLTCFALLEAFITKPDASNDISFKFGAELVGTTAYNGNLHKII